ncbi:far upstream element-binding protein 1-like [Abrus precatorius]|uniref:Far upstream element-binding protein 1-like n=1 Tax=Abrus precatorius TaxID=3816 RepID=A0A8B8JD74_ABRPR|nr:far upstream element-binding protein 1-like [Abrus precatorius]
MADESPYSANNDTTTPPSLKRKYNDDRPTGFSDTPEAAPPPSYNSVPPPAATGIELAKQRAQEVAARLLSGAPALDPKRPKLDNGSFDSIDVKVQYSAPSISPSAVSYAHQGGAGGGGANKKIEIPNGRVGVIIGKGGETIKYLQFQSGAKIQVTRDMDADPNSATRMVELMGTPDAIASAEKLINEVLTEAEAGGSGIVARRLAGQAGSDEFVMKIPNNKVGLVIGKGGETIKNMQASTGARIQVIPLHLPPGDTSTERTLKIEGTPEQIESAKQVVNQVISGENRLRNPAMSGGYSQQGYQARPPTSWVPPPAPMQQPGYGYVQPGGYSGPSPQYNMSQPPYAGYPPQSSGGYSTNWDQSTAPPQQSAHGGYDYYGQQPLSQQQQNPGGPAPPADGTAYNYSQPPSSGYNQPGQGYAQDGYGAYHMPPQSGYGQPPSYDQQQGYSSASGYGVGSNPAQEGHTPNYGSQGDSSQVPPVQPSMSQGYGTSQQPSPNAANYPPQGAVQPGYGVPPTSQPGYGSQPPVQSSYGPSYGPPQTQKPSGTPPVYGQSQSPNTAGGYGQSAPLQSGYPPSQPPPSGYAQQETGPQRAPPSGFGGAAQPGYGPPSYGAPAGGQPGYGQAPPSYGNSSYGAGYPQPPVYSSDGNAGGGTPRGSYDGAPAPTAQQGSVAKTSPQS